MLVGNRMTTEPLTAGPDDLLIRAWHKMKTGGFRRLPVVKDGKLVGIVTDRDLRDHHAELEHARIGGVMTENPLFVAPDTTLEEAAQIMLEHQIGGLPVVENETLVGIITASDVLRAFLDMMGASEGGSARIDLLLEGEEHGIVEASRVVAREGGAVLGIGTYRDKPESMPRCYLRLQAANLGKIVAALRAGGFDVKGVHPLRRQANATDLESPGEVSHVA